MSDLGMGRTAAQSRARLFDNYTGDGDYRKWASRGLGALAGGALGYMGGGVNSGIAGLQSGWDKGAQFSQYQGWGDYGAINNQIMGTASGASAASTPVLTNASSDLSGDISVANREFVCNVTRDMVVGATGDEPPVLDFQLMQFSTNPGNSRTFPFLSNLAKNFELFEMEGLVFQFIPLSTDSSESGHSGKVIMSTNYDMFVDTGTDMSSYQPFTSSRQMQNYDYTTSAKPQVGQHHGVETASDKRTNKKLFIDEFGVNGSHEPTDPFGQSRSKSRDKNLSELGTFCIATEGIETTANNSIIGELWVSYKCHLSRAKSK